MLKNAMAFIVENKVAIQRRALIVGGTVAGLVVAGVVLSKFTGGSTDVTDILDAATTDS